MKKLIFDNQDLEEMEKSFYNDLISNKNNISYWYPKIKDCGIKQPKTFIYQVPKDVMKCFFHDKKDDSDKITEWVRNGGTVIVDKSTNEFNSFDEITEYSDIKNIIKYSISGGCSFYIKNGNKPLYDLEEIS